MNKQRQKQIAIIAGALVLAYLAYRYYTSRQSTSASTGAVAPDATTASDYAALAGQEQSDMAAVQGQAATLSAQEQSDVAGLQGSIAGLTSTVGGLSDQSSAIGTLTGQLGTLTGDIAGITASESTLGTEVVALAAGQQAYNRAQAAQTIQTHKGGPFYNYYVRLTGHPPPASVNVNNAVYQMWKQGVKISGVNASSKPHPSAPKQTQVAHPNGNHSQQSAVKPKTTQPTRPAATAPPKVTPAKPKTKPKPSGVRR
jgi:hypothetical protein